MLTSGELAKLFEVSSQTIINWLENGRIPYQRIGNGPRKIKEQDILDFIKKGNSDGTPISMDTLDQKILATVQKAVGEAVSQGSKATLNLSTMSDDDLMHVVSTASQELKNRQTKKVVEPTRTLEPQEA